MAKKPTLTPSTQILARLNAALEESGLSEHGAVRDPLPLFRQLWQEWLLNHDIDNTINDDDAIGEVLKVKSAVALQSMLRSIFEETVQLSSAHGTLSVWTRRELDQELRRLQAVIENLQHQREANIGK